MEDVTLEQLIDFEREMRRQGVFGKLHFYIYYEMVHTVGKVMEIQLTCT